MTTNDFTEAARAEAERRHPDPVDVETGEPVDDWGFEEQGRRDFLAGAEWARDYLAVQEPDDAGELVAVSWTDCDCEWMTSYCDENHRRTTRIPRSALTRAARRDEEKRNG